MKTRFMGGVSFLPLFAADTGAGNGGEQADTEMNAAEVAERGDPDFEANDLTGEEATKEEPVKAEAEEEPKAEEEEKEDPSSELEQLRKTTKALGKRISVLSREKRELSAKLQSNIKEVPKAEEPEGEDEPQRSDFKTKSEFEAAVEAAAERKAQQIAAQQEFNKQCNAVEAAGLKAFGGDKWAKAKAELAMLDDHGRIPMDILSVALETDDPARVLFVLGNDIEKATELMGMTPIKRAIAMDKIAASKPAARAASKAPPPVDPLGGRGGGDERPSDRDSDEEWNRKEALRERKLAEQRRQERGY